MVDIYQNNNKENNRRKYEWNSRASKRIVDHLGIDESKVIPKAKFIDDLGADSLDTVELVMAFEEKFGSDADDAAETFKLFKNAKIILRVKITFL